MLIGGKSSRFLKKNNLNFKIYHEIFKYLQVMRQAEFALVLYPTGFQRGPLPNHGISSSFVLFILRGWEFPHPQENIKALLASYVSFQAACDLCLRPRTRVVLGCKFDVHGPWEPVWAPGEYLGKPAFLYQVEKDAGLKVILGYTV